MSDLTAATTPGPHNGGDCRCWCEGDTYESEGATFCCLCNHEMPARLAAPRAQTEDWYCAECGSTKETHIWGEKDGHITHPFQPVLREVR